MNVDTPFSIYKACKKFFGIFCYATWFYNTSYGARSCFSTCLETAHFNYILVYSVFMLCGCAIFITPDCSCSLFVNGNFCKGQRDRQLQNACKNNLSSWEMRSALWTFHEKYLERAKNTIQRDFMLLFRQELYRRVGLKVPITESDLRKWSAVVVIPNPNIIQGGIQLQS